MDRVLRYRAEIYGVLAVWIIIYHLRAQVPFPECSFQPISRLMGMGDFAVDVFLFLAGYCATLSLQRSGNTVSFYKKRFLRVGIPLLIIAIPFFGWRDFIASHSGLLRYGYDVTGLSFWIGGDLSVWFGFAILLFYLFSPAVFTCFHRRHYAVLSLVGSIIILLLFQLFDPHISKTGIAWMRIPAYLSGMACGFRHPFRIEFQKGRTITAIFYSILLIAFISFPISKIIRETPVGLYGVYLVYLILVIPFLYIASALFSHLPSGINKTFAFIGRYSLELYLIHTLLLIIFHHYGWTECCGYWMLLIIPVISLITSILVGKLASLVRSIPCFK